LRAQRSNLLT